MEISGQTRLLLPIMLSCKVASVVADYLHPHSLFHAIIEFKGLTFLGAEAPSDREHELDRQTVKQIVSAGSVKTLCSDGCTIGAALKLLEGTTLRNDTTYAIIDKEERFEGTLSLCHLLMLTDATVSGKALAQEPLESGEISHGAKTTDSVQKDAEELIQRCREIEGAVDAKLDLRPVVNSSSYSVRDSMSILRAYNLFRTMGCRNMIVVDVGNKVVGMLTRNDLVDICHPPHEEH